MPASPLDLYTIDPTYAMKAWELAHYYGYDYAGQADFNDLTCLKELPTCFKKKTDLGRESELCRRHSEGRYPKTNRTISAPSRGLGFGGWADAGCVEAESSNGTYVGVRGLISRQDLASIESELDPSIAKQLNETLLRREGTPVADDQSSVVANYSRGGEPVLQASSFNTSTSISPVNRTMDDTMAPTVSRGQYEIIAMTSGILVLWIFRLRRRLRPPSHSANIHND